MLTIFTSVLIGILYFTKVVSPVGFPILDTNPLTINVAEGDTAILPCTVRGLGRQTLIWFSPYGSPIGTDTQIYQGDRYEVIKSQTTDFNLSIKDVTESDAGVYICMVLSQQAEKKVTLQISSPPTIDQDQSTTYLKVIKEGESLMLRCVATGKPEPTIRWYRITEAELPQPTREDLGRTGSTLTVDNVSREAAGSYQCVASNGLEPNATREIVVTVHYPPYIYAQKDKITTVNGKTAIFECIAEGYPLPKTIWSKDGETITFTDDSKYEQGLYEELDTLIHTLRINVVDDNDYSVYTCEANNRYGKYHHDFLLEKKGVPKISVESNLIRKMKSENAELVCRVRGFPNSVVWFKNREEVRPNRRYANEKYTEDDVTVSSLTIVTLESSDFDTFVCQAHNNYGSDEVEIKLEMSSIDISGPTEGKVGRDISLTCNATTNSIGTDEISWLKNGRPLQTSSRITTSRDIDVQNKRIVSNLYIRNMKLGDKGTYTCRTRMFLTKSHRLNTIEVPDEFISIDKNLSSPSNLAVNENTGPIHLRCMVEGFPRVLVSWHKYVGEESGRKLYKDLSHTDEVLTLDSDRSVAGTYQCRTSNGVLAEETMDIYLDVHYPVSVSVSTNDRILQYIGAPFIAECNVTGNPIVFSYWSSSKGPNKTFDHTLEMAQHDSYRTVAMKIMEMSLEDFGTYSCIGGNNLGNDSASIIVMPLITTTTSTTSTTTTTTTTPKPPPTTTSIKTTIKPVMTTEIVKEKLTTDMVIDGPEPVTTESPSAKTTMSVKKSTNNLQTDPADDPNVQSDKELNKQGQETGNNNHSSLLKFNFLTFIVTVFVTFLKL